jgi:hypothetical protein
MLDVALMVGTGPLGGKTSWARRAPPRRSGLVYPGALKTQRETGAERTRIAQAVRR